MSEFRKYRRTNIAEIRPYVEGEVLHESVSISQADRANGSPKLGDMIARNPESHEDQCEDQWLISADYFAANFEPYDGADSQVEIERLTGLLKGLIDAEDAITDYRVKHIGPYPDGPIPEEVRAKWNRDLDSLAAASLKAGKAARAALNTEERG